jgi:predicted Fe-S protein YdhL (DUF1289 family)
MGDSELTYVLYCDNHEEPVVTYSTEDKGVCAGCQRELKMIGWCEYAG